ncbi:hypothetical protein F4819DRAFT_397255 [Hypoxylon fuscum]|nr:hypothetical protein F4819DRAFT_397255 [Hypoxylon fuscum]
MAQLPPVTFLESLWSVTPEQLRCCQCRQPITSQDTLARTFTLVSQKTHSKGSCTKIDIIVPAVYQGIQINHRHLNCLFQVKKYVVVSHVWHPGIAELQRKGAGATANADEVARFVREVPVRIAIGLVGHFPEGTEIWHDYISVPQWAPDFKNNIIVAIPQIFGQAESTVAYLSDIDSGIIEVMRQEIRIEDRIRAVSTMCNATWFSRVWTAMEYVESKKLRAMLRDFTLIQEVRPGRDLLGEMLDTWGSEVKRQGEPHVLEKIANMGVNLVPWQLGPLELIRHGRQDGLRATFANAYELLAKRCITVKRDFFYAFLHVLSSNLTLSQLSDNDDEAFDTDEAQHEALLRVARSCIEHNDYTPLFMIPPSVRIRDEFLSNPRMSGYQDLRCFSMGHVIKDAPKGNIRVQDGFPVLKGENLGVAKLVKDFDWYIACEERFAQIVEFVFGFTGSNVEAFIDTLVVRLYSQDRDETLKYLSYDTRMIDLKAKLASLHNEYRPATRRSIIESIADSLCLSNMAISNPMARELCPIRFLEAHGRTLHLGNTQALVAVECSQCHETFILRVGLLKPLSHIVGAVAYRVPGLHYLFTHEGGAGWLVKDGHRVARFVWGTPTCECPKLEEVTVRLNDLPLPEPNEFKYGSR